MTLEDLKDKLAKTDEVTLLEWLDLTSVELIYYLDDVIQEKQADLIEKFNEEEEDGE